MLTGQKAKESSDWTIDNRVEVKVLTRQQVAACLQVSENTIDYLKTHKLLMPVRVGRHDRWLAEDVDDFLRNQRSGHAK